MGRGVTGRALRGAVGAVAVVGAMAALPACLDRDRVGERVQAAAVDGEPSGPAGVAPAASAPTQVEPTPTGPVTETGLDGVAYVRHIHLDLDALTADPVVGPAVEDLRFLREGLVSIGEQETILAAYSRDLAVWSGDGPYLRIIAHRDPGLGARLARTRSDDAIAVDAHGRAWYDVDESTDPARLDLPEAMARLRNAWASVSWAVTDDVIVVVQGKGFTQEQLVAIARATDVDA